MFRPTRSPASSPKPASCRRPPSTAMPKHCRGQTERATMRRDGARGERVAMAMVQMRPLPGSYRYGGEPIGTIVEAALAETAMLAEAGFDALQLQNMGDNPSTRRLGPETVAYMTAAALAIRREFPALSLGILANWDAE